MKAPDFPELYRIIQLFDDTAVGDLPSAVRQQFAQFKLAGNIKQGQSVAITVGSRGIDRLAEFVATFVGIFKSLGLKPFIIPAMGSHGNATAEGQKNLLRDLGVSEESVAAPIVSSMETVMLDRLPSGAEVFLSADALNADHLFVFNRVKPHTAFRAEVESGLCKMLAVGCGKRAGAESLHKAGLDTNLVPAAELIASRVSILGGMAVLENSLDKIHTLKLVAAPEFAATDRQMLSLSQELLPRIPIQDLDILIVDQIGKNISGAGLDPNVIGFWRRDGGERVPEYDILIPLDLTRESHGNALGVGLGDLTTQRLVDKIDYEATYTNAKTACKWRSASIPIVMEHDRAAVELALSKVPQPEKVRLARIHNTLHLETFWVTKAILAELRELDRIRVEKKPRAMSFDADGGIFPFLG